MRHCYIFYHLNYNQFTNFYVLNLLGILSSLFVTLLFSSSPHSLRPLIPTPLAPLVVLRSFGITTPSWQRTELQSTVELRESTFLGFFRFHSRDEFTLPLKERQLPDVAAVQK
eukprot:TRINITY_DN13198_c0_g1_i6.p1 TRINITY_DN13198_c0_g1~~TRINITY_DN13198_c0_g1_i6.p1  ORF type:complete len:113 (+),score=17.25 TRINITY_DN13198_c0_g1_i6:273-611(+)